MSGREGLSERNVGAFARKKGLRKGLCVGL